jgi:prevent-host-death family protein
MKFSTDELMPFFEVRTGMSKHLDDVQAGKEIVITRHGKPEGALISAAQLYRYREVDRLMVQMLDVLARQTESGQPIDGAQVNAIASKLLALGCSSTNNHSVP